MEYITLEKNRWSLTIAMTEQGITLESGRFGGLTLIPSPLFRLCLESAEGAHAEIDSAALWGQVSLTREGAALRFRLSEPAAYGALTVTLTALPDETGISWTASVENHSPCSVTAITYPTPTLQGSPLHLFIPDCCGRALLHAGERGFFGQYDYPGHNMSMQYFAWWGEAGGLYLGLHDPDAAMKTFRIHAGEGQGDLHLLFHAIGAGTPENSFAVAGSIRWEAITGDWYDATLLYRDFVHKAAHWLPKKGRPDTSPQFKEIPYWICDYIPNSKEQGDACPMTLASVSERYGKDYWVDAPIALKERLGTPVGYHVYNWHEIPFNIGYPHFLPARPVAREGMEKLRRAGLYVFPYINAVSWEMDDGDEGYEESFASVGIQGAVLHGDGTPLFCPYPQRKSNGQETRLAPICPSFERWHTIIESIARGMEADLPIDGIYFDQIAAVPPYPCRNPLHHHRPGGGSYWSDGYRRLMERVNAEKPRDRFYFTESNAEPYVGSFDGLLTWVWTMGDDVPAFPAIYAGYVQMLGRYTDGAKRDDDDFFRYHLAKSLLFGQQLGWLNAHVVYNEERMAFLEKLVRVRYRYTALFNEGRLLRPPHVESPIPPVTSSGITMEQVVAGAWQTEPVDGESPKTVLFAVNLSHETAETHIRLYPREYGAPCPESLRLTLAPLSVEILEYGE